MTNKKLVLLNTDGSVFQTLNGYDPSGYIPAAYDKQSILVNEALNDVFISVTSIQEPVTLLTESFPTDTIDPTADFPIPTPPPQIFTTASVSVNPLTEQLLEGTGAGSFINGEMVYQTTTTPTIVNNYVVGGVTLNDFVPVIGSIGVSGEIGSLAGQFKGTYNDLAAQKAAGIRLPAFTTSASTPYFLLEGWIYFENEPSNNYDPIILTRSADGVNSSTNDSFRLEYDSSSDQIQFHYSDSAYASAGYRGIVNVSPSGVSMGEWNHFAVAWATNGGSAAIKTYWNGTSLYSASGFTGHLRNSTAPLMVGSGISGDYPLKAWLDDVHVRMGGVTLALADYAYLGSTAANPFEQDEAGQYTVYLLPMKGTIGSSVFPVENLCRVSANVSYNSADYPVLGVANITREETAVAGLCLFGGVCGGFTTTGGSGGYLFGHRSGAWMSVTSIRQLSGISAARDQRINALTHTNYFLMGVTTMQGASGASGDFPKLFSSGWTGTAFSFLPTQANVEWLRNHYDNVAVVGYTGNTVIEDYYGTANSFGTTYVKRLYEDVIVYRTTAESLRSDLVSGLNAASTMESLKQIAGYTKGIGAKVAQYSDESSALFIPPTGKMTKSDIAPEKKNLPKYTPVLFEPWGGE